MILLSIGGCKNHKTEENLEENMDKRCVTIFYGLNSSTATIYDIGNIEEMEKLFDEAEFAESTDKLEIPYLSIHFEIEGKTYRIDKNDTIRIGAFEDYKDVKAKNINFDMLYQIYSEYIKKIN